MSNFKSRRLLIQCLYSVALSKIKFQNETNATDYFIIRDMISNKSDINNREIVFFNEIQDIALKTSSIQEIDQNIKHYKVQSIEELITSIANIIYNIKQNQNLFDGIITKYLSENWKLSRIALLIKLTLECAIYEILFGNQFLNTTELKTSNDGLIITDYLEIAKSFNHENEVKFINNIIDKVLKNKSEILMNVKRY